MNIKTLRFLVAAAIALGSNLLIHSAASALKFTVEGSPWHLALPSVTTKTTWEGRPTTVIDFSDVSPGWVSTTPTQIATSPINGNATIQQLYNPPTYLSTIVTDLYPVFSGGGHYLNVGTSSAGSNQGGWAYLNFDAANGLGYFGLFWGSPSINDVIGLRLRQTDGTTRAVVLRADQIFNAALPGHSFDFAGPTQNNGHGRYVSFFTDETEVITAVSLLDRHTNGLRSFEVDNIAYQQRYIATVPTPAAVLPGLLGLGVGVWRKRQPGAEA